MTKVEALKKLFETLGGDPDEVVNETQIAEMIDKISEVAEGGGGTTPKYAHYLVVRGVTSEIQNINFLLIHPSPEPLSYSQIVEALSMSDGIPASGAWGASSDSVGVVESLCIANVSGNKRLRLTIRMFLNLQDQTVYAADAVDSLDAPAADVDEILDSIVRIV